MSPAGRRPIKAMDEVIGPVIGITLVLMAVFLPTAFLPGHHRPALPAVRPDDRRHGPHQRHQRRDAQAGPVRPLAAPAGAAREANVFYRGFNRVYGVGRAGYARLVGRMVRRSGLMVGRRAPADRPRRLGPDPAADRLPADRGPGLRPDRRAAARRRLAGAHRRGDGAGSAHMPKETPGVDQVLTIGGISVLDNSATPAQCRRRLRGAQGLGRARQGEGPGPAQSIFAHLNALLRGCARAPRPSCSCRRRSRASATPAASRCRSRSRNGDFDYPLLQSLARTIVANGNAQSALQRLNTSFRAGVPQLAVAVDRVKAKTLGVTVGHVFSTLSRLSRLDLRNAVQQVRPDLPGLRPGRARFPPAARGHRNLKVKAGDGKMVPLGTLVDDHDRPARR